MTYRIFAALAALCLIAPSVSAADKEPEVLTRGPVHEAFAQPVSLEEPKPGQAAPKPPPEPIEEQLPDQKPEGDDVQWIPGYWQWDDERGEFLWVPGIWRDPPPDRKWVPGSWREIDDVWRWIPGFWLPEGQDELRYLPPLPESKEEGPAVEAPSEDSVYVPGIWLYRDTRYVWRPGYWLGVRPGWVWCPSHYGWTPAGLVFVPGCWDRPLERRGVFFAPVYFADHPRVWTPSYAVSCDFLTSALFVRSGHSHYCFGDYFHPQYRRWGYSSWIDHKPHRHGHDHHYGYYRSVNKEQNWDRDLRGHYDDRYAGRADRPPRTLAQQETAVRNLSRDRGSAANIRNATVVKPLAQSARADSQMVAVARDERERQGRSSAQLRESAVQRGKVEQQIVARKEAPLKRDAAPRTAAMELPRGSRSSNVNKADPPPRPNPGRVVDPTRPAPRVDAPKPPRVVDPPKPAPRVDAPKPPRVVDPPKPAPRVDPPKPAPRVDPPKPAPRVDPPKPAPRVDPPKPPRVVDPPKPAPRVDPPKPAPRVDPPKPAPRVDPPKPPRVVDPPKPAPRVDPPKPAPRVDPPKPAPRVDPPKPAPRVDPPKAAPPRPAPRVDPPKPAPPPPPRPAPVAKPAPPPAPRPAPVAKPAPPPAPRPAPAAKPAPPPAPRPAPAARPAPTPQPKPQPRPAEKPAKPNGKPKR